MGNFAQCRRTKIFYIVTHTHTYTCVLCILCFQEYLVYVNLKFRFDIGKMYVHIYIENLERKESKLFSTMFYIAASP